MAQARALAPPSGASSPAIVNRVMEVLGTAAALSRSRYSASWSPRCAHVGAGAVSLDFFTKAQEPLRSAGRRIANAFVGTALLVVLATAMALPVGVLSRASI